MPKTSIWSVGVVVFFVVLTAPALEVAYAAAETPLAVENEPVEVTYNGTVAVDQAGNGTTFTDDVTVTNASGVQLTEGDDYAWAAVDGEVTFYDTAQTSSGETVHVDYRYHGYTQATANVWQILSTLYGALGVFIVVVVVRSVWDYVRSGDYRMPGIGGGP